MQQDVAHYLADLQHELLTGHAQEHSYRPALKALFEAITKLKVVNEPKGSAHGRPDFIFLRGDVPLAYAEAKDITVNLDKVEKSEQMARYYGYPNLILTNGLEFRFFKNGARYGDAIVVAKKDGNAIEGQGAVFGFFADTLTDFIAQPSDTIRDAEHLAKIMGGKARRLRDNITEILDPAFTGQKGDIENVMQILKAKLIHDITPAQFADLYAQTLVYGLFVARYNDKTKDTFSRVEARECIPASNHLLQQFFDHIAGTNFLKKLSYIVDELCDVFVHSSVHDLVHGLYQQTSMEEETHDPIIHFYEDFLKEYDPGLRMSRGVFYTPLPVVRFIVRSVDALLKEHFGLSQGLADRTTIEWPFTEHGKTSKKTIDRVQILDPAVGTGTFLNEVIRNVHERYKERKGEWPAFVNEHLIPRLHGFELMMASYTIAHLKLSMTLAETGIEKITKRLRIFLTNSLEKAPEKDDSLFRGLGLDSALTEEALLAEEVKRDLPIMVVLGNPPYSGHSMNKGEWIEKLIADYKKEPGGGKLQERNAKWLNDDYVKFIRLAEYLVDKNSSGIVAMITNHSYLDNPTFRGMRWHLLQTFDDLYILDLHGNTKKKEVTLKGGKDENVFDIQQGVAILLAVKKRKSTKLADVHVMGLHGLRSEKYDWLNEQDVTADGFSTIKLKEPDYAFVKRDYRTFEEYEYGLNVKELFPVNVMGFQTHRDDFAIAEEKSTISSRIADMFDGELSDKEFSEKYHVENNRDWKIQEQRQALRGSSDREKALLRCTYRPFDLKWCYFSYVTMDYPRKELIDHVANRMNQLLIIGRQGQVVGSNPWNLVWNSNEVVDANIFYRGGGTLFPLYLYPDSATVAGEKRTANLDMKLLEPVLKKFKLTWIPDGAGDGKKTCGPEDVLDYIYAVLHCPAYRSRYKEFLKIDFPRVPFTSDCKLFWKLVSLGREIRSLHLMESPKLEELVTGYPVEGDNVVEKVSFEGKEQGKVWINKTQYFDRVPLVAWNFFIGGYQPLQKWLKDRKGRTLSSDDMLHWQKIVVALLETDKLMKKIDEAIGKWPIE